MFRVSEEALYLCNTMLQFGHPLEKGNITQYKKEMIKPKNPPNFFKICDLT